MKLIKGKPYVIKYIDKECPDDTFIGVAYYQGKDVINYLFSKEKDYGVLMCFDREHIIKEYRGEPTHICENFPCYVVGEHPLKIKEFVIMVHHSDETNPSFYSVLKSRVKFAL